MNELDIFFIFGDLDGSVKWCAYPDGNYIFNVDTRNTRTRSENMFKVNKKDTRMTPVMSHI